MGGVFFWVFFGVFLARWVGFFIRRSYHEISYGSLWGNKVLQKKNIGVFYPHTRGTNNYVFIKRTKNNKANLPGTPLKSNGDGG